jgi:LPXTG-site transpeptidase (sortase) family protein
MKSESQPLKNKSTALDLYKISLISLIVIFPYTRHMPQAKKTIKKSLTKPKSHITIQPSSHIGVNTKLYFILGCLFMITSLGWRLNQTIQLTFFTPKVIPVEKKYAIPTHITIPKVGIDLATEETAIRHGAWQISDIGASHLTDSARPGEDGPIIMYSHNTNERFGPIRWLSKGEEIKIKTADGKEHAYKITQTMTVSPSKMDVFTQRRGETLILYTCDGFADLERFIVIATPR